MSSNCLDDQVASSDKIFHDVILLLKGQTAGCPFLVPWYQVDSPFGGFSVVWKTVESELVLELDMER